MKESSISTKKTIIVGVVVLLIAAILIATVMLFGPDPMPVDWDNVQRIPSNVTLLDANDPNNNTGSVALVKYNGKDADGNPIIDESPWKVLQFTDMHLTQEDDTNEITLNHFIETIKREKPDFVALTGDIITRPEGRPRAVQLAQIFEKMGVYWCYCLGNHEGDSNPFTLSREELIRIWSKYDHCLVENDVKKTQDGREVWGLGNTVVNLLGENHQITQSMIFLDSGNRISTDDYNRLKKEGVTGIENGCYDFLKTTQIDWYEEQVKKAASLNENVKSMLFIHIPLVQMSNVQLLKATEVLPDGWYYAYPENSFYVGDTLYGNTIVKNGWKIVGDTASYEKCYCSDYDSGMYAKMLELRKWVNALFCGHDHINNTIFYQDAPIGENTVYLCYGVGSGLQSYNLYSQGLSDTDDYHLRGYSKIMIHADSSFDLYQFRYNDIEHPTARILGGVAQNNLAE